jgi:hypothetical protein
MRSCAMFTTCAAAVMRLHSDKNAAATKIYRAVTRMQLHHLDCNKPAMR